MPLAAAWDLVTARKVPAQLVVLHHGEPVLDRAFGCARDDLFWLFSASKPYLAIVVRRLAHDGRLDLDAPVARYWPAFGAQGKEQVTVRDVLRHRSTVATAGRPLLDALAMANWDRSTRRLATARPRPIAADRTAYGFLSYGFILGEVVQRVTGRPLRDVMAELVFEPLGAHDTFLGIPAEHAHRAVPLRGSTRRFATAAAYLNQRSLRSAVIPAAGISATARDVALLYEMLRRGGSWNRRRLLPGEAVAAMLLPTAETHRDLFTGNHIRWTEGFQLGGPRLWPTEISALGSLSSPQAFGHNGSGVCIGWADPTRALSFAYVTAGLGDLRRHLLHLAAVADAVLSWCDDTRNAHDVDGSRNGQWGVPVT